MSEKDQPKETDSREHEPTEPGVDGTHERTQRDLNGGESSPTLMEQSILSQLGSSDRVGVGVSLQKLHDEAALPAIEKGSKRYQILRTLGEGGMGKVHLVADHDLRRQVAMKVIRTQIAADGVHSGRFLKESQILGQLEHPNIVPLYDLALSGDRRPYCTMRYVRGRTLAAVLAGLKKGDPDTAKAYSVTRLMQILQQISQALGYAHDKGVMHRDLKPDNVMLGEHGEVQVLDWGLASIIDRATSHEVSGTPAYMAPEQTTGQAMDGRVDVYAMGVMMYELLTLERPFHSKDVGELMALHRDAEPESPRSRAPGRNIPLELEQVCLQALRKDPAERQQSAAELADRVQGWMEAAADREKRHQLAETKASEGRAKLEVYQELKRELMGLRTRATEIAGSFKPWQPEVEKAELFAAQGSLTAYNIEWPVPSDT